MSLPWSDGRKKVEVLTRLVTSTTDPEAVTDDSSTDQPYLINDALHKLIKAAEAENVGVRLVDREVEGGK